MKAHENAQCIEILPIVLLGIRTAVKEDIKASCVELVYGITLQLPNDINETSIIPPCDNIFVDRLRNTTRELNPVATCAHDLTELWSVDAIGIRDPVEIKSRQVADEEAVEFFRKTIKRNQDKRYEVYLPWKSEYPELESNKELVTKRLMSATKTLIRSGHLSEYVEVLNKWIREGIIEVVDEDKNKGYYLPHHPATTSHHLENVPDVRKETARQLQKSFYVDNCITSLETREEVAKFISEDKELMSAAKFDLRGWITSDKNVEETQKRYIPILGLSWNSENDELSCNSAIKISEENITKRTLLSIAQRIYDPIRFTSPTTLIPKIILQKTWEKINWDDVLPPDICNEFLAWYKHVNLLKDCKIPRRLIANPFKDCQISLHCFSDASKVFYAACISLRAKYNGKISIQLAANKPRLSPIKEITISRLELLRALIIILPDDRWT
ncbi:hypothetical protein HNY73_003156 [Argiope bruennichi]|uniref:Uncharacterized protein n=1 Tax=Argiope bruennichi TaxID=94029 RepID=A0A8T0FYL9_ARGBR|nr:hypothetical protein HNY73_003156 [Argiope bruennichi]